MYAHIPNTSFLPKVARIVAQYNLNNLMILTIPHFKWVLTPTYILHHPHIHRVLTIPRFSLQGSSCFTFIVNLYHCTSNPSINTLPLAHSPYHIWTHDLTPPMPLYSPGVHFFVKLNTTCDKINKSIFYIKRHRNGSNFYQLHCQIPLPTILLYKWFIYPTI